jgi:DNA repair exonuclease SbcCD ATPase subunit
MEDRLSNLEEQIQKINIEKVKTKIAKLKKDSSEVEDKISSLSNDDHAKVVRDMKEKISDKKDEIESTVYEIAKIESDIQNRTKLKNEITELNQEIKSLAVRVDDLKLVSFVFSKNGIPSQEIENAFTEVEDEINFVLSQFGTPMEVLFSPDRELNDWEKSCVSCGFLFPKNYKKSDCSECGAPREKRRKDELQLKVMLDGQEYGFYMESGGGKTILSLAIRVALTRLKLRKTGSEFKVLFLDEVDAPFDEDNRDKFISLVNNVLVKKLGFHQVFWVSHSKIISEAIPHTLLITKKGSYAEAEFV